MIAAQAELPKLKQYLPLVPKPQTLRPYQQDAIVAIKTAWAKGKKPLVSVATGGGKTSIFAQLLVDVVDPNKQRALVIAHTTEIVEQMYERIWNQFGTGLTYHYGPEFYPGIGIVMGAKDKGTSRIVVGSRQSLHQARLGRVLASGAFDYIIIDEAHHAAPQNTYADIVKACQAANPNVKIAGFTATAKRSDGKALAAMFDEIVYEWSILDGIAGGYLVPPTAIRVNTGVDLSAVASQQGDYANKQMLEVLSTANWIDLAVKAYNDYIALTNRSCLAFFPEVEKSKQFTAALLELGISAAHIDANTPKEIRAGILKEYSAGKIKVVSNMSVLCEGFDAPITSAILMCRPTRSEPLRTQILGRGFRLYPGKKDCLVVQLVVADAKLLTSGTLLGKLKRCRKCLADVWLGYKECPNCGASMLPPPDEEEELELKPSQGLIYDIPSAKKGKGLFAEEISLFADLECAWYQDKAEWQSTGVGFDKGALVIVPPTGATNATRLRERLMRGAMLLSGLDQDDPLKAELISQIEALQRELRRIDAYSLYYVSRHKQAQIELISMDSELSALLIRADKEALRRGGDAAAQQVKKTASWRFQVATEGQKKMIEWSTGKPAESGITKGQAAAIITHARAVQPVEDWLQDDLVPEPVSSGLPDIRDSAVEEIEL